MPIKVAILGGAGQIAWHCTRYLTDLGYDVKAVCRSELVAAPLEYAGVKCAVFDANTPESVKGAVEGSEIVVDTTFSASARLRNDAGLQRFYAALATSPGLRIFIHLSSVAVYGELSAATSASERPRPDTIYGEQKLSVERLVQRSFEASPGTVSILRLGHVYGPHMAWSAQWLKLVREGTPPAAFLKKPSNAVHVAQVCQAIQQNIET